MNNCCPNTAMRTIENIRGLILGLDTPVMLDNNKTVRATNLDNAATTPPFKRVENEIHRQMLYYGSIGRGWGQKSAHSTEVYANGRAAVKEFVGAISDLYTVFYVNNTTDGINKLASALIEDPNDMVLSTRMEHHANDLPWRERATTVYAEVDGMGRLLVSEIERLLAQHGGAIKYVCVTAASNVTGYVNDVHAIAAAAHRHGAQIIVDGAQIVAHRPFRMLGRTPEENIDFFVFSAHKMYAPYGGGAVVGLTDVLNRHIPKFYGGGMVEGVCDANVRYSLAPDRYEAGSPNYPGVVGMLEAIKVLKQIGLENIAAHEQQLLARALQGLAQIPGVILYGDSVNISDRVGIIPFTISGISPADTASLLAGNFGIAVRHAAFCAHPYVRRLTREQEAAVCAAPVGMVRVSFGLYNDERDVDRFLCAIRRIASPECRQALLNRETATVSGSGMPNDRG